MSNYICNILDDEYPDFRPIIKKIENPVNQAIREKTVLTDEQVQMILDKLVETGRYEQACFFALAIYSGRRKSELLLFKVPYFDDENIIYGSLYKTPEKIRTKGRGVNGKMLTCYVLAKPFKPYFDLWMKQREERGIESEWLFPDKDDPSNHIQVSTANSWAEMYSRISGLNIYLHSLRHAFTTNLARADCLTASFKRSLDGATSLWFRYIKTSTVKRSLENISWMARLSDKSKHRFPSCENIPRGGFIMSENKNMPTLNMRYYNKEIDDDLPYVGALEYDEETGLIYDEDGDVVDEDSIAKFCEGDGRGDDEDD